MKCPFVERECVKENCTGWIESSCFVRQLPIFLNKLTNNDLTIPSPHEPTIQEPERTRQNKYEPIVVPPHFNKGTVAIDFGTSFSKSSYKAPGERLAIPIPLGSQTANILHSKGIDAPLTTSEFVTDSMIYINRENKIFCGNYARQILLHDTNSGNAGKAIHNFKLFLIGGGNTLDLSDYFSGSEKLSIEQILSVYLAHLFSITEDFLEESLYKINIEAVLRNFSIPVWSNKEYRTEVIRMMERSINSAYYLEKWFKTLLVEGVSIKDLLEAFGNIDLEVFTESSPVGTDVTEPVSAGYCLIQEFKVMRGDPKFFFVIDIGAGSSDFAFYSISQPVKGKNLKINLMPEQGVDKGISAWDNALRLIIKSKLKDNYGLDDNHPNLKISLAKLEANLPSIKEKILSSSYGHELDISPVSSHLMRIDASELNASAPVQQAIGEISDGVEKYIQQTVDQVERKKFTINNTTVLITGGGSYVSSLVDSIKDRIKNNLGPYFAKNVLTNYTPKLYNEIPNVNKIFPMLAVSLGATNKSYPTEGILTKIKGNPGKHVIGGYFQKGN